YRPVLAAYRPTHPRTLRPPQVGQAPPLLETSRRVPAATTLGSLSRSNPMEPRHRSGLPHPRLLSLVDRSVRARTPETARRTMCPRGLEGATWTEENRVALTYPTLGSSTKLRRQGMTGPLPERKSTKGRTTNQRPKAEAGLSADCRSVC